MRRRESARVRANRVNAAKSTGPRSAEGKARSSQNALRHGLAASLHSVAPKDPALESLIKALCEGRTDHGSQQIASEIADIHRQLQRVQEVRLILWPFLFQFREKEPLEKPRAKPGNCLKNWRARKRRRDRLVAGLSAEELILRFLRKLKRGNQDSYEKDLQKLYRYERRLLAQRQVLLRDLYRVDEESTVAAVT